ncbi:ABC transporter ATP-binding protein [Enterococcus cecorum]|uniref:ABC transporter ATP-binding protein n=1 Tax=Enterococcus cecorum TaxID=44008 RepID=UPI001FAC1E9F|nr:ABC transporter ATP-binding protein [Enterococcus cecorum]MCJ0538232.1 ABC transporter ATP-binding protein/permease [Enterococcus cecorum]MCJ0545961.1 ABC transporter ATP-binding protein/permease [Enterococcus cecorum]MCJ0550056.1 ABC transporter ATP-binding protein/permease [Enterococcus cecorum]MCJ0568415.1 ABC transporter ATP-binding protein/permease [Enterococcus cecorum]
MFRLFRYASNYKKEVILGPIFKFLEAVFELLLPLFMAKLVDQGISKLNIPIIWQTTLEMILISIIGFIFAIICQYYASVASQGLGTELRNVLMKKINTLNHQELNHFGTESLITRLTNDVTQIQWALAMLIRLVSRAPFLSIGAVIMAFSIDLQAGLIFLAVLPIFCLLLYFIMTRSFPMYQKVQEKLDQLNQSVAQNLSGIRVIRAFVRTKDEVAQFNQGVDELSDAYLRVTQLSALLSPATTLMMNLGIVGIFLIGGQKVNLGHLQAGQVLALVNYMNQMLLALIIVANLVILYTRAHASAKRINEVLDVPNAQEHITEDFPTPNQTPIFAFQDVDFRYGSKFGLALKQLNFAIQKGETIGIIGATGSGKTSLISLLPRFYEISGGVIQYYGKDIQTIDKQKLREQIALVPQTSVLFNGTIRENLQWGKVDATDEQCWQALETAQAKEFVEALPEGLDTSIFEGGKNFSGGQKQRLTIARALISQRPILILDDSLSALDYQTDLNLRQALQKLDCTTIIISQRIRSIQGADQILVLDNGSLVGCDTHEQLLTTCPTYQEIYQAQQEDKA